FKIIAFATDITARIGRDAGRDGDGGAFRLAPEALMLDRAGTFDASGQKRKRPFGGLGIRASRWSGAARALPRPQDLWRMLPGKLTPATPCRRPRSRPVGSGMWST